MNTVPSSQTALLGAKIRQLRYRQGMTQAQLAGRAGVGEKTLKRLELGKTETPHPETLAAVAGALGLRPEELFEGTGGSDRAPEAAMPALRQLPRPPRNFTGREREVAELLEYVTEEAASIVTIQGMGGIGKTALGLVVAERLSQSFADGQFYLDLCGASEPTSTPDAMLHVIRSIEPQRRLPTSDVEVEAAYRSVLSGKRCLLLMDNASGREQVSGLIPPEGSLLLLTSRQRFALSGERVCSLSPLPSDDSRALIRSLAPHAEVAFDHLAGACGGLPLALSLVGRALSERPDLDPIEYAARLADDHDRLQQLDMAESAGGVEATFALSYEMLEAKDRLGLCALSVCPQHFDRVAASAIWGLDDQQTDTCIGVLLRFNLLESSGTGSAARYRLHDLVRLFAASRLEAERRAESSMRHAGHFLGLLSAMEQAARAPGGAGLVHSLEVVDREWTHIQAAFMHCWERSAHDPQAAALCRAAPGARTLVRLRVPPPRRIEWCKAAIETMGSDEERRLEGGYLVDSAHAYQELGDARKAIECAKQVLSLCAANGDKATEAGALVALSDAYHAMGAPAEAIECGERGLALAQEQGEPSEQALALVVLGWGYRTMGEFSRAIECCERALAISRDLGDRSMEGAALLALSFAEREHPARAREVAAQCLQIAHELGDRRMEGYSLISLGDDELGEQAYEDSLSIAREIGDRRMKGHALLAMGFALSRRGEPAGAIVRLEESLEIAKETGDRSMESMVLAILGVASAAVSDFSRAIEVLTLDEEMASEMGNRRQAALAAWFLCHTLEAAGNLEAALSAGERVVMYSSQTDAPIGDIPKYLAALRARLGR